MSEEFLHLPAAERQEVYGKAAQETGMPTGILEKDVWICWILDVLFNDPGRAPLVFKGGTSLSKLFNAIDRFSEDIDLTVRFPANDPNAVTWSRSKRDQLRDQLNAELRVYLESTIVPLLTDALAPFAEYPAELVSMPDAETVIVDYPSCYDGSGGYVAERVKLEFGCRNQLEPNQSHEVRPYITCVLADVDVVVPSATVDALAPQRTFWEKATLAHDECNRDNWERHGAARISRHWYDLAKLL